MSFTEQEFVREEKSNHIIRGKLDIDCPYHIAKTKELIQILAKSATIDLIFALENSPKSWMDLLKYFKMQKRQSGHLGHFMRIARDHDLIKKDQTLNVYYLTFRGRKCAEFLNLIQPLANLSIHTPEIPPTPDELKLDIARPWLESLLIKHIKRIQK